MAGEQATAWQSWPPNPYVTCDSLVAVISVDEQKPKELRATQAAACLLDCKINVALSENGWVRSKARRKFSSCANPPASTEPPGNTASLRPFSAR
eukprot:CAMPEP_0177540760 /NCGR_PEP_ID=MMETSP0369-20130122/59774_1 /TAXON_ID=447022 ORGANISM="Scrippsiella hangoei-like, Strain SHHI-4" /NCGR_SAMPLE_ID=MMETSP0369 /ASSEMBLY_ACC=CAM_ASM_000364 /LENGTH=94 /DNA_ID=CAMNT_0019024043 /DNA_START=72 /DNA_END=357 /DNA_ORIENTATION=+